MDDIVFSIKFKMPIGSKYRDKLRINFDTKTILIKLIAEHFTFNVIFNGIDNRDIKSSNDIASITLSLTHTHSNLSTARNNHFSHWENVIGKRYDDIEKFSKERDAIIYKLTLWNSSDKILTEEEMTKMSEEIKILCMQIGVHTEEINNIKKSSCEVKYEERTDIYRIDLPCGVMKYIDGIPEQTIPFKIVWNINDKNMSGVVVENLSTTTHSIIIPKVNDDLTYMDYITKKYYQHLTEKLESTTFI